VKSRNISLFGIIGLIVALILVNGVSRTLFARAYVDLTDEGLYSLSLGTKNILGTIEEPISLKYYFSRTEGAKYPSVKLYGNRILDLLRQYERASGGKLKLEVYDPRPDSEEEEWAEKYGLQALPGQAGEKLYLGLAGINSLADEQSIPVFNFARQEFLEYDITRVISSLVNTKKPAIGVMSSLEVMSGMPGQESNWFAFTQLAESANVTTLSTDVSSIDKDLDLLILIHPKKLSNETLFAIDQFVMRGGRLIAFVDPFAQIDSPQPDPQNPMAGVGADHSSSLNQLTAKWGVELIEKNVVGDIDLASRVDTGTGEVKMFVLWPNLNKEQINSTDISTSKLENMLLPWPGALKVSAPEGVQSEVLLESSDKAALIEESKYRFNGGDPAGLLRNYTAGGEKRVFAVRIRGKLQSNFPDGLPKKEGEAVQAEATLKETTTNANVVVVSDVDFLTNRFSVQIQKIFGTRVAQLLNDNLSFFQNVTENMLGSDDLISIRSRGQFVRPFTLVEQMETEAQQRWQQEELYLEAQLNSANNKLTELQARADSEGKQVVNKEVLNLMKQFKQERREAQDRLRSVRRNLRQDIESLGTRLFLVNTFLFPLLLIVGSFIYASMKRR